MIIQLVARTFNNDKEARAFENFFFKEWKNLIVRFPNCRLTILRDNYNSMTFNALWEFPNKDSQDKVMQLIKINNKKFNSLIPNKSMNFSGKVVKSLPHLEVK